MKELLKHINGDRVIWVITLLLAIVSVLAVYSSVTTLAYRSHHGDATYFLIKHVIIVLVGFVLMYLSHNVKYTYYSRIFQVATYLSFILLFFTLLRGVNEGSASRWLEIPGTGLTFQTSDFAKLALIVYVARMISIKKDTLNDFKTGFIPIFWPIAVICGLIFPTNISTSVLLFTNCLLLMLIGGVRIKFLLFTVGTAIAGLGLFILVVFAFPHTSNRLATAKSRIENFVEGKSSKNYQVDQAMIAIATGKPFGKGPGHSVQKNFLPQASSDFIYAILIEEYGLPMGIGIVLLYLILFYRGIRIAINNGGMFGTLLALGISLNLILQALVNICVAIHLLPVTGQPLPLISMGGTSIWFTCISIGVILSVSNNSEIEKPIAAA